MVGYDVEGQRVKRLEAGESYVEDIPSEVLAAALATGRYQPTSDAGACADFDVAVITVPTPLREGVPDLSHIDGATATLGPLRAARLHRDPRVHHLPGTTEELVLPVLEAASGLRAGTDFHLGYSPERIDPGNDRYTLVNTPKVVSGIGAASLAAVESFYATDRRADGSRVQPQASPSWSKLLENTFRHVNIALVNELAMFAVRARASTCGRRSTRRRPSRSGSCPSPRALASAGTACPSTPATCPGGCAASSTSLPLRRAGQRRQRAHARLRGQQAGRRPQPRRAGGQRQPHPAARPGLQAQHQRRAGVPGPGGGRPPRRAGRRRQGRRSPRGRGAHGQQRSGG